MLIDKIRSRFFKKKKKDEETEGRQKISVKTAWESSRQKDQQTMPELPKEPSEQPENAAKSLVPGLLISSGVIMRQQRFVRRRLFWGAVAVFVAVVAIGAVAFNYFFYSPADKVELSFVGPEVVKIGERTRFQIVLANLDKRNTIRDLSLTFKPDKGSELAEAKSLGLSLKYLEKLGPGSTHSEDLLALFWGKQGEKRVIEVAARYRIGNSNALFEKTAVIEVTLADLAISLGIDMPQQVVTDQTFRLAVEYKKLTPNVLNESFLILEPPFDFQLLRSDPEKDQYAEDLRWSFADLEKQTNNQVVIDGKIVKAEGQGRSFAARLVTMVRNQEITLSDISEDLVVIANPLVINVALEGKEKTVVSPGERLLYKIGFKNNYNASLKNVIVEVEVSDPWFRINTLDVFQGGFYFSQDKRIIWNGGTTPQLLTLNPRESGEVGFAVELKDGYPENKKNNTVTVKAFISTSDRPKEIGNLLQAETVLEAKINGVLKFRPRVVFRDDPNNGFLNSGQIPLKANTITQFSAYFMVQAWANDFKDIVIKTVLPVNVRFEGRIKGDTKNTDFVYNPRTGELSWSIDKLEAFTAKEIVFQLDVVPSIDQIGKLIPILNKMQVSGVDLFTGNIFFLESSEIKSDLPDDETIDLVTGKVVP